MSILARPVYHCPALDAVMLALLLLLAGTPAHALTSFSTNIACNAHTQWHCTCYFAEQGVEGWELPNCDYWMRDEQMIVTRIQFEAFQLGGSHTDGRTWESQLRNVTARLANKWCLSGAHKCPGVALPVDTDRVVILRAEWQPARSAGEMGITDVYLVLARSANVHVLDREKIMAPGVLTRLLNERGLAFRSGFNGVHVKSIKQAPLRRLVNSPHYMTAAPEAPNEADGGMKENKVLVGILSSIGISICICYVIAIYKVCVDYHKRKRAARNIEEPVAETAAVALLDKGAEPSSYGAIDDRPPTFIVMNKRRPTKSNSSNSIRSRVSSKVAPIEHSPIAYDAPADDVQPPPPAPANRIADSSEGEQYSPDTYDYNNRVDLAAHIPATEVYTVVNRRGTIDETDLPDEAPPPPPPRRDVPALVSRASTSHESTGSDPYRDIMFDAAADYGSQTFEQPTPQPIIADPQALFDEPSALYDDVMETIAEESPSTPKITENGMSDDSEVDYDRAISDANKVSACPALCTVPQTRCDEVIGNVVGTYRMLTPQTSFEKAADRVSISSYEQHVAHELNSYERLTSDAPSGATHSTTSSPATVIRAGHLSNRGSSTKSSSSSTSRHSEMETSDYYGHLASAKGTHNEARLCTNDYARLSDTTVNHAAHNAARQPVHHSSNASDSDDLR